MFKNQTIRQKFLAMLCLPLAGLLLFSGNQVIERARTASSTRAMIAQAKLIAASSNLVHEMHKERGLSAAYMGSGGKEFASKLKTQRQLTDARLTDLQTAIQNARLPADSPAALNFTNAKNQISKLA